jgi:drug/metabolite transporter (DMT)-like permease
MRQLTPRSSERMVGIGLVNLATLTWAINMVLGRWLRDDIGPLTLAAARFLIASLFFVALLRRRPPQERRLRFTTAVNATLINGFGPLITGLLSALLIREPMSGRQLTGAIVGLAGVIVLISGGSLAFWQAVRGNVGDLIVLGAVALWGLYSVLGHQVMRHRSVLSATALSVFLGLPLLLLAAVWEIQTFPVGLRPEGILAVLYIGIAPAVIGFLSWNSGVRRLGSSGAMVFYNMLPLYGALLGYLFLGESIGPAHLIGGALIIGGGLWAARGRG